MDCTCYADTALHDTITGWHKRRQCKYKCFVTDIVQVRGTGQDVRTTCCKQGPRRMRGTLGALLPAHLDVVDTRR